MGIYRTSANHRIDISEWHREDRLKTGGFAAFRWSRNEETTGVVLARTQGGYVELSYGYRGYLGDWRHTTCNILLAWTRCHYGGWRAWFLCPRLGCGRRVRVLYGGAYFACRQCHDLTYDSQNTTVHGRAIIRARRIQMKLGGSPSLADPFPEKPKGLHWKTYNALKAQAIHAANQSCPPWVDRYLAKYIAQR